MELMPQGMLRIATMVRDGGRFEGSQVIARYWIERSLQQRTSSPCSGLGYGWFLSPSRFALARGYGGQIVAAHRERDLAVAITSDTNRPAR